MSQMNDEEREVKINDMIIAVNAAYSVSEALGGIPYSDKSRGALQDGLDIILERCITLANEIAR